MLVIKLLQHLNRITRKSDVVRIIFRRKPYITLELNIPNKNHAQFENITFKRIITRQRDSLKNIDKLFSITPRV